MNLKAGNYKSILFICSYNAISGGLIAIFEHAYRLKLNGYDVYLTFRHTDGKTPNSVFPRSSEINVIDYGQRTDFDIVVATFWTTVYNLADFSADHYLYFSQSDERLFYKKNHPSVAWAELTYSVAALCTVTSAKWLAYRLNSEFSTECHYAPIGLNLSKFTATKRRATDKIRVLIEGSGKTWFKRIDDAFKTAENVSGIELWYVTVDGYVSSDWKPDRVFKELPYSEMPSVYQSCDILLKMSEVESFGLPNLEMMACGGCIITTAFTGQEEYAVDGENAFVVEIGDVKTASHRLQQLIDNPDLRQKFAENGIKTAATRDWNTLKPTFADAIEKIIIQHPAGNAKLVLPKLQSLSQAFREYEAMQTKVEYLDKWREGIQIRERHFIIRIANKLYQLLGKHR